MSRRLATACQWYLSAVVGKCANLSLTGTTNLVPYILTCSSQSPTHACRFKTFVSINIQECFAPQWSLASTCMYFTKLLRMSSNISWVAKGGILQCEGDGVSVEKDTVHKDAKVEPPLLEQDSCCFPFHKSFVLIKVQVDYSVSFITSLTFPVMFRVLKCPWWQGSWCICNCRFSSQYIACGVISVWFWSTVTHKTWHFKLQCTCI